MSAPPPPAPSRRSISRRAQVRAIGICGSGVQARLQAEYLKAVTPCRDVIVWARDPGKAARCAADLEPIGLSRAHGGRRAAALAAEANLIVTTTASHTPLSAGRARPSGHAHHRDGLGHAGQERSWRPDLLARADRRRRRQPLAMPACAARSIMPSRPGCSIDGRVVELGAVISSRRRPQRSRQITIADLTGVAVQDIKIAKAVCARLDQAGSARLTTQGGREPVEMQFPTFRARAEPDALREQRRDQSDGKRRAPLHARGHPFGRGDCRRSGRSRSATAIRTADRDCGRPSPTGIPAPGLRTSWSRTARRKPMCLP